MNRLDEVLSKYRESLAKLDLDQESIDIKDVATILLSRLAVEKEFKRLKLDSFQEAEAQGLLEQLFDLDEKLQKNSEFLSQDNKLSQCRKVFHPPEYAWWFYLDTQTRPMPSLPELVDGYGRIIIDWQKDIDNFLKHRSSSNRLRRSIIAKLIQILLIRDRIQNEVSKMPVLKKQYADEIHQWDQDLQKEKDGLYRQPLFREELQKTLNDYRHTLQISSTAWWWDNPSIGEHQWRRKLDWVWNGLTIVCLVFSASWITDTARAFSTKGFDFYGAFSTLAQTTGLAIIAGGTLTDKGRETVKKILTDSPIPSSAQAPATFLASLAWAGLAYSVNNNLYIFSDHRYYPLAEYHRQEGHLTQAQESYMRALKFKPDDPKILLGLGTTYEVLGDYERAIATYQEAINGAEPDSELLNALGRTILFQALERNDWKAGIDSGAISQARTLFNRALTTIQSSAPSSDGGDNQTVLERIDDNSNLVTYHNASTRSPENGSPENVSPENLRSESTHQSSSENMMEWASFPFKWLHRQSKRVLIVFASMGLPGESEPSELEASANASDLRISDLKVNLGLSWLLRINLDNDEALQSDEAAEYFQRAYQYFREAVEGETIALSNLTTAAATEESLRKYMEENADNTPINETRAQCYLHTLEQLTFVLDINGYAASQANPMTDPRVLNAEFWYACSGLVERADTQKYLADSLLIRGIMDIPAFDDFFQENAQGFKAFTSLVTPGDVDADRIIENAIRQLGQRLTTAICDVEQSEKISLRVLAQGMSGNVQVVHYFAYDNISRQNAINTPIAGLYSEYLERLRLVPTSSSMPNQLADLDVTFLPNSNIVQIKPWYSSSLNPEFVAQLNESFGRRPAIDIGSGTDGAGAAGSDTAYYVINRPRVNVRSSPSLDASIARSLPHGTRIQITGNRLVSGDYTWVQMTDGNWIVADFLIPVDASIPVSPSEECRVDILEDTESQFSRRLTEQDIEKMRQMLMVYLSSAVDNIPNEQRRSFFEDRRVFYTVDVASDGSIISVTVANDTAQQMRVHTPLNNVENNEAKAVSTDFIVEFRGSGAFAIAPARYNDNDQ